LAARDRVVVDVNALAIFLVQDHPGNPYITPELEKGLRGQFTPLILDIIPLRAYWIMTKKWRCDAEQSEKAIRHFLDAYPSVEYPSIEKKMIHDAFKLAGELPHDVFDTLYLAAAVRLGASGIMTTDTDFRKLCPRKNLRYLNPVPARVLEKFGPWQS